MMLDISLCSVLTFEDWDDAGSVGVGIGVVDITDSFVLLGKRNGLHVP